MSSINTRLLSHFRDEVTINKNKKITKSLHQGNGRIHVGMDEMYEIAQPGIDKVYKIGDGWNVQNQLQN